jgi:acetaldehyde dehydrogenase (acetylating)
VTGRGPIKSAIVGPGNIGTDLLVKLLRVPAIEVALMIGIYPDSPGLARARELGVAASADGIDAVLDRDDIALVFDATSAKAHASNAPRLLAAGKRVVDLTPAAVGPFVVPSVNLAEHVDAPNVNMVSCGGQATIPFVHAIHRVAGVAYAEIVATIASASAGPGTRQNIDEFTETTARGLSLVGGAAAAKAIIVLNPADPPILMRDTIFAEVKRPAADLVAASVQAMTDELRRYVPGVRPILCETEGDLVTVMVEIEGAGDFLPRYAGNLDIMTAAAAQTGAVIAERMSQVATA